MKVRAFGLNRMDILQREGKYPVPPQGGKILGVEFSGTIEELGSNIKENLKVGDEVFGLAYGGAYAEYIVVSTHMLMHKPQSMTWETAAGIPEVGSSSSSWNVDHILITFSAGSRLHKHFTSLDSLHLGNQSSGTLVHPAFRSPAFSSLQPTERQQSMQQQGHKRSLTSA